MLQFGATPEIQLLFDARAMGIDRGHAQLQSPSDVPFGLAPADQAENLQFTVC